MQEPLRSLADACIHCGLCLDACPTYAELGAEPDSPRGRIYFMRALLEGRLEATADVTRHLDSCLGCRACEPACPSGVQYGHLLEGVRAGVGSSKGGLDARFWRWVVRHVLPDRRRFRLLTLPARLLARTEHRWLPPALRRSVEMFPPSAWGAEPLPPATPAEGFVRRGRAGFLAGCAMPILYPQVNSASVKLLARAGYDVIVPESAGCCGALQAHDGDEQGARQRATALRECFGNCDVVVTNSAGCGAAMKGYPREFAGKVRDLSEALLFANWLPGRPLAAISGAPPRVAYHDPCHLSHGQGVRTPPRELLRRAGASLTDVGEADYCCGGAGSYTLLQPELSDRLMVRKLDHLLAGTPDMIVSANPSCLMQIRRGLAARERDVPVLHLAEVLWATSSA